MAYSVVPRSFESLEETWNQLLSSSATDAIFITPRWQQIWWSYFGNDRELLLLSILHNTQTVGIAPLMVEKERVALLGSMEVCDYLDFVLPQEHCRGGLAALLGYLEEGSWTTFVLHSLPSASPTLSYLQTLAEDPSYEVLIQREDVCPRIDLPSDWESYLAELSKKDRHELRRKLRRLEGAGAVRFYPTNGAEDLEQAIEDFLRLHRTSREDKAAFMTPGMAAFFRKLVTTLVPKGIGRLFFLELNGIRVASALCFDYANERLLYNSGYDRAFSALSVGLLLKAYLLREAIETGMRRFDFLRGNEPYKYDLGGVDYPIYQCTIQRRYL